MRFPFIRTFFAAVAASICIALPAARAADEVDYARDVLPILQSYCIGCHTEDEAQGGLVMESHEALMKGGESGAVITPGVPDSSRLVLMLKGELEPVMPPEGETRPAEGEIETLLAWIEQGATGPDGDMPLKRELRTPEIETAPDVKAPITAIAISGDGVYRAVARFGSIEIIDATGTVVTTIKGDLHKINSVQFSQNGDRILVASGLTGAYGNAAIYSVADGQLLKEFVGHKDVMYDAVFSPDQKRIATAGYDRTILLWDADSGEMIGEFEGHNGAVFDLAFSPDGKQLVSACADETGKVWDVENLRRLDTLNQPEGEVFAVRITPDGKFILAGSADNRLRVWRFVSKDRPRINPIVATRFVDESPLVDFELTPDGKRLVVLSAAGNLKLIETQTWNQVGSLEPLNETGSDLAVAADGKSVVVSLMNGEIAERKIPASQQQSVRATADLKPIYLDLEEIHQLEEATLQADNDTAPLVQRGVEIRGTVSQPDQVDRYRWKANKGEVWAIDADAAGEKQLDPIVAIFDSNNQPVVRTRLQAVRDSYFTFRGKDSDQTNDFRLFNWEEMRLGDYLYAAGEVVRLYHYPRGPDSGYNVFPNEGNRWTYFGTSHTTHALGEPAYIVRPLDPGEDAVANGLPVFDLYYENDDDPQRVAGTNSRLLFTAPEEGVYTVAIGDTRGDGGEKFEYQLRLRPAKPSFQPSLSPPNGTIRKGTGREFVVRVNRVDGFDGPVTFDIPDLPEGVVCNVPLTVEADNRYAVGNIWVGEHAEGWEGTWEPKVIATAEVLGRRVEREAGTLGKLTVGDPPSAIPFIEPIDNPIGAEESWTLQVRRGETVSARVVVRRKDGFENEINFGNENAGRNTPHGVYVDNIGLNGLLVRQSEDQREFFLTADPIAETGKRSFFLTGQVDGGVTTLPITLEVLP